LALLLVLGCQPHEAPTPSATETRETSFDPSATGTVTGRVTWDGDIPLVRPLAVKANQLGTEVFQQYHFRPNPNAPRIDARTRAVRGAVVFLRGVDARRAKPWDHPPVQVEQCDCRLLVHQGDNETHVGFVRRGDAVTMVSEDDLFHSLHADGSAYFTLTFPDPGQPRSRRLERNGVVELASAAGYFWMRAYLFVDEHPYYTRTDDEGRFALTRVPPGHYDVVCWLPNWAPQRQERDPESGHVTRLYFQPPLERVRPVTLVPGETAELQLHANP
jgi:hypothetical protein